jgi:hypothetical protein
MTTNTKTTLSVFTMALFFMMAIASSASHKTFKDADNWMPQDFNPNKGTLLVETHPVNRKQNDRMLEFLQKNYPYPYEVADSNAINSKEGKYADTKKYPFAVTWKVKKSWQASPIGGTGRDMPVYDLYGNFVDRTTGKVYPTTKKINNYGQIGYIPFFNSITGHFK